MHEIYKLRMNRLKRLKKIRLHSEGTNTLVYSFVGFAILCAIMFFLFENKVPFYITLGLCVIVYLILVNFFRCPIRLFPQEDTIGVIVAPADGKVVVVEEVEEHEYFHDRRMMVSIFMSLTNVHANWFPCDGIVTKVAHQNGRFKAAWLPKASTENERSMVVIRTPEGIEVMARQVAGAMARRIVTYAKEGEECFIDEHMGFIKLGSRVDVYLPLGTKILVQVGQKAVGNETILAKL